MIITLLACAGPITNAFLLEDQEFVSALPLREHYQLQVDDAAEPEGITDLMTVAWEFNTTAEELLGWVDVVKALPPTERSEEGRVWGPHIADEQADLYWRVTIERTEPGRYGWRFALRAGSEGDWVDFFTGESLASFEATESQGSFVYDSELLASYTGDTSVGVVEVDYDYIGQTELWAEVRAEGVTGRYFYEETDSIARLQYSVPADAYDVTDALEDVTIAGRWWLTGGGRSDMLVTEGDLDNQTIRYTECWDVSGQLVYTAWSTDATEKTTEGAAADCAFDAVDTPVSWPQ